MIVLYSALALLVAFILIIVVRALCYKPITRKEIASNPISFDKERVVETLAEMIRAKTVSSRNPEEECEEEFVKFKNMLPRLFPNVFEKCSYEEVGNRALLFRWKGKEEGEPLVLMAHYDVVSVEESGWSRDAFAGIIEDGFLWGRGTLDTKGTLNGILSAAESLISQGFTPERDIYFAFAGDEEITGHGAQDIIALFEERGIIPAAVIDEGGAVVEGVFPGVRAPAALIGIAEKGVMNVEYSISGGGGHASSPPAKTPIGRLSKACVNIEKHPFKRRLTAPALKMFDTLARNSNFAFKLIFANLWCFSPVLDLIAKKSGGEINAMVRTTVAFTQMEGSKGANVIPAEAKMVSNLRLMAGDTVDSAMAYLKKKVNDDKIELKLIYGNNPSRISRTDCGEWSKLTDAISETWTEAIPSPYLMVACSDSRHWGKLSDKVYRFSAMALSKEERASIHGNNERIPLETIARTVAFYIRLMNKF